MQKLTSSIAAATSAILLAVAPAQAQTGPSTRVNGAYEVLTARVSAVGLDLS